MSNNKGNFDLYAVTYFGFSFVLYYLVLPNSSIAVA